MKRSKKVLAVGMGLNLVWTAACSRDDTKLSPRALDFSGSQSQDSTRTSSWKGYLQSKSLLEAWTPPEGSLWTPYVKPTLFSSLDEIGSRAKPIYGPGEIAAETAARNFARYNRINHDTVIFLDLLGGETVAWGATLARELGLHPVATFNNWPHQKGVIRAEHVLGSLIYYAAEMAKLKQEGKLKRQAPPVFMLDYHRLNINREPEPTDFDNRYYLVESDLPSPSFLKSEGVKQVLYVLPFSTLEKEQDDLNNYFSKLQAIGIQFALTSAQSYADEKQILTEKQKRERESRSTVSTYYPWLFFYSSRAFTPVPRQTIFSGSSGSTAAGRFVRSSGGGFGGVHGVHSGGGAGG